MQVMRIFEFTCQINFKDKGCLSPISPLRPYIFYEFQGRSEKKFNSYVK